MKITQEDEREILRFTQNLIDAEKDLNRATKYQEICANNLKLFLSKLRNDPPPPQEKP